MGKDVTIFAPPAHRIAGPNPSQLELQSLMRPPSAEEIIQQQDVEIRRLQRELSQMHATMGTIANATVACVKMIREKDGDSANYDELMIPIEMQRQIDGAQIKVRRDADMNLYVSYAGGDAPMFDGRPAE